MLRLLFLTRFVRMTLLIACLFLAQAGWSRDLNEIKQAGVIRHIGVPYAHFVTGGGDGLDVELIRGFARQLGVEYQFIETNWGNLLGDLIGHKVTLGDQGVERLAPTPVRGDIIASGLTVLDWRKKVIDYSDPIFPTAVWLLSRADSSIQPIKPSGSLKRDITRVKALLAGRTVLGLENTCLDPKLYQLSKTNADIRLADNTVRLNEMAPAIINRLTETTLLDVPDALIALDKWPGKLKVIGPISERQVMAAGFRKASPELRHAFNRYLQQLKQDGTYLELIKKYYPTVFHHYGDFFQG